MTELDVVRSNLLSGGNEIIASHDLQKPLRMVPKAASQLDAAGLNGARSDRAMAADATSEKLESEECAADCFIERGRSRTALL